MWFKKEAAPAAARVYKFEDFVDSQPQELPEDAPRIDVLSREVQALREQVRDLEYDKSVLQSTEDWFRMNIADVTDASAKRFAQSVNSELLRAALESAGISAQIEQAVQALFQREAQALYEAVCRAVMKRLGRGL